MALAPKSKLILISAGLLAAFAIGRYTAPTPSIKEKETTKIDTEKNIDKETKKKTTITETPDGKKITTIDEESNTKTKKITEIDKEIQLELRPRGSLWSVSGLAGYDFSRGPIPVYGAAISKEFIGPITLGAFGLTNGTVGLSLGVNF